MHDIQALEARRLLAAGGSSVDFVRPDGGHATLLARRDTWVVIHGLGGSAADANMKRLAAALDAGSSRDQVVELDWSAVAGGSLGAATAGAPAVAAAAAAKLKAAGVVGGRLNIVGYSLGAYVTSKLAALSPGGVNRIVALDPASPVVGKNRRGTTITDPLNLAKLSNYSVAFRSGSTMSHVTASGSADDTVRVDGLGTGDGSALDNLREHVNIVSYAARALEVSNGVAAASRAERAACGIFSMKRIMTAVPGQRPWAADAMGGADDVTITVAGPAFSATALRYREAADGALETV